MERPVLLTPSRLFVLLGLLFALAVIGFRAQSLLLERERLLQQRQAQASTLAQFAATYSARLYDSSARLAEEVAQHVRQGSKDPAALREYLRAQAADSAADDYIVLLDRAGKVVATSEEVPASAPTSYGRPDFEAHWRDTPRQIETMMRSRLTGAVIYSLTQRVDGGDGAFAGAVSVNVRPEGIRPTAQRKPEDPLLTVWGQDGRFVAASLVDFDPAGRVIPPSKPAGLGIPGSPAGKDAGVISATAPVDSWPLIAVASYDKSGVLAGWRRDVVENALLILLVLAGVGALVWFGTRTARREEEAKESFQEASKVAAEALKDRDLLLKEVHHRVKNSLLMTSSLIHLQARQFDDPEVREAFESTRRRLNSIGLVHEVLYGGADLEEVDLSVYLPRLLHEIAHAHGADERGVRMNIQIDPIRLEPDKATPVGLVVAEVVTNAFKHAFGADGGGEIVVRGALWPNDEVEIVVHDDGKGYPDSESTQGGGLGNRLIRALTEQLGGRLSFSSQGGAVFRMTFPRRKAEPGDPVQAAPASAPVRPKERRLTVVRSKKTR